MNSAQFSHIRKGLLVVPRFERIELVRPTNDHSELMGTLVGPNQPMMVWGWTKSISQLFDPNADDGICELELLHEGLVWYFLCNEEEPWYEYFDVVSE